MAIVIQGSPEQDTSRLFANENFGYEYPGGLDLKPTSKLHRRLVREILERAHESVTCQSNRYDSWRIIDQLLTAYKPIDKDEKEVLNEDSRKPVSIVFPYSYAILETLLSYMVAAFFQDPLFNYEGYSPEDVMGAILLEQVVNLHCNKFKVKLNLHTMFRDAFAYGRGVVAPIWKVTSNGNFEGNALINIDPYRYLPDPNVAAGSVQDGSFVGWSSDTNYMNLLSEENSSEDMFNVRYLKCLRNTGTSIYSSDQSDRQLRTGTTKSVNNVLMPVAEIPMYIKIIPKDWELSDNEQPEIWFFRLAADSVIITARPANFKHGKFPIAEAAPDYDGYSPAPISKLEIIQGLQGIADWEINSHVANVRKSINDMLIFDPYALNSLDFKDPKPGKLIRARRPIWGQGGVEKYVKQLQVNDITRANISDATWIMQWMQKIVGTDNVTMGNMRESGPERLTKAEFQGTMVGAVNRLERTAKIIGVQAMQDIGEFFAEHTQQMMSDDAYVKVVGEWKQVLLDEYKNSISRGRMRISPDQINVMYDVIVRDGSIPGNNYNSAWMQLFNIITQSQQLMNSFDVVRIFKYIARNSGAKNVDEFVRRGAGAQQGGIRLMPDQQVLEQQQAGNITPMRSQQ